MDVQQRLEELRVGVTSLGPGHELDEKLWRLSQATEQIVSEHAGMAEELLGVYEQLGFVFEVTRKLTGVQSETKVLHLFTDSLRSTFDKCSIDVVYPSAEKGWFAQGNTIEIDDWMRTLLEQVRDTAHVVVESRSLKTGSQGTIAPPQGTVAPPRGVVEVMAGPVFAGNEFVCGIVLIHGYGMHGFQASDMMLLESLGMFCGDLIRNHRLVHELGEMSIAMVRALVNAIDQKDPYTSGHSLRVGYFATALGARMGLTKEALQMLQWSALLHDVGKIGIRESILNKKGKLTDEEYSHIQEHPVRSHQVVQEVPQLAEALDGVLYHHERFDGRGYPVGLAAENIPLQARIIQVADIFDALTSDRSYRSAYDWRGALQIIENDAGTVCDPVLVKVFVEMMRDILDEDESAWERLIERANQFTHVPGGDGELLAGQFTGGNS